MSRSKYELAFETYLRAEGADLPEPWIDYEFHPTRKYRFDFAWPLSRLAVEIDGGNRMARINSRGQPFAVGRHTQGADYAKRNEAVVLGWRVLQFTGDQVMNDPAACIAQVRGMLERERMWELARE